MQPLSLDDLLPLDEYAGRRREFFEAQARYLDRYRRIRIGPQVTLLFENRQTLWFRVQELLRVARLSDPALVQDELDLYNRLLPGRDCLQAALLFEVPEEARLTDALAAWRHLQGDHLQLRIGTARFPAELLTCRPEDRAVGTAHWVTFHLDKRGRQFLADDRQPAHFALDYAGYQHASPPLSEDVRQSLMEDLEMSDRG